MKGFLILGYNKEAEKLIDQNSLEEELKKNGEIFFKAFPHSTCFDNIIGYQILKRDDIYHGRPQNIFISGEIFGDFSDDNMSKLSYSSAISFLNKRELETVYSLIEGNASICGVFNNSITFQNDLEGHRKIFYYRERDIIGITNNLPFLLKTIKRNWKIRKNAVTSFLLQRESKWPLTFIEDVLVLPPLSKATFRANILSIESKTYSSLYDRMPIQKSTLRESLYLRYRKVLKRQLTQSTAITLSGGYDSNCLAKLLKAEFNDNFTAVSVGYQSIKVKDANYYNETIYAEQISKKLNIPFKKYIFDKETFFSYLDDFILSLDQPGHDPSSNFILNKHLKDDGFENAIIGMGGDACFSPKTNLNIALKLLALGQEIRNFKLLSYLSRFFSYKGPFNFFKNILDDGPKDFYSLYEMNNLSKSKGFPFVSPHAVRMLLQECHSRIGYFSAVNDQRKSDLDVFYSFALFCNPDEYHATLMAERNNVEIIMPFIDVKAVLMLLNGSCFHNVTNRDFETSIFGGIHNELLLKSKSGFSIPYSEWLSPYASELFDFYSSAKYFADNDYNFVAFQNRYDNDKDFAASHYANQILWKLLVLKKYVEKHSLNFQ